MSECRFCQLAADMPGWIIDHGDVVSFKPFGAENAGHRLFVPKVHVDGAADDPAVTAAVTAVAAQWAAERGHDFNLHVNSGKRAGQTVFHLHVHYIPRYPKDES